MTLRLDPRTTPAAVRAADGEPRRSSLTRPAPALVITPRATECDDPAALGHRIARWRASGALAPGAVVWSTEPVRVPPAWGLRVLAEGRDPDPTATAGPLPRRRLVLGGAGSGKSGRAELLLAAEPRVRYLATGRPPDPTDPEWSAAVRAHRDRRPAWWTTVEAGDPELPARVLRGDLADGDAHPGRGTADGGPPCVLWDSVGTWLTAVLDRVGAWEDRHGWSDHLARFTDELLDAWECGTAPVVAVAEEVGWGVVPATASGRLFRRELGRLNQRLARGADTVELVVAGRVLDLVDGLGGPS